MAFHEKEPITAAASMAHCEKVQVNRREVINLTYSDRDKLQFRELACPPAIQVIQQLVVFFRL